MSDCRQQSEVHLEILVECMEAFLPYRLLLPLLTTRLRGLGGG